MKILIGAPVLKREWILPLWFERIKNQNISLSNIGFIFETAPEDSGTKTMLMDWHWNNRDVWCFDVQDNTKISHQPHPESGTRKWTKERYHDMATLRNSLLKRVRSIEPDFYFSLDTDILLDDPDSLTKLIECIEVAADAVSPVVFMSAKTTAHPGVMTWAGTPGGRASRKIREYPLADSEAKMFETDVIMAAKMMSPDVYKNVDYEYHRQGEDLGWCYRAYMAGYRLYCSPQVYAPHIMSESHLEEYKTNGDKRLITLKDVD